MSQLDPNLADLLRPTFEHSLTMPVLVGPGGELVLVLITPHVPDDDEVLTAVALQHALRRGVLVLC